MYCQKCGADNLENAAMCQSCGGIFVYSQPSKTSGMAITAMILGISGFSLLGVFGIVWIISLIFGIIALNRINKSGGMLRGKGFAITGIITSAVGLAVVLTIIGVGLFVSSARAISLSKKLKMYDKIIATAAIDQRPTIDGWVCILKNKANPEDKCTKALFVPGQFDTNDLTITTSIICGSKGQMPVEASWQFAGEKDKADIYDFTITFPVDESSIGTSKKKIIYDGTEQVIFEDAQRKIFIKPAE
jgi:aryl carrier-like protein